jgi:hypothetical protein
MLTSNVQACNRKFIHFKMRRPPLGRPRRRWENNIKADLKEVGCGGVDWIELAKDREQVAGTCECGNEPSVSIKCGVFLD